MTAKVSTDLLDDSLRPVQETLSLSHTNFTTLIDYDTSISRLTNVGSVRW